jgi:hypothetical protein
MLCGTAFFGYASELQINPFDYITVRDTEFPNAHSYASYDYEHWAEEVWYCPDCRQVERQWIDQHSGA